MLTWGIVLHGSIVVKYLPARTLVATTYLILAKLDNFLVRRRGAATPVKTFFLRAVVGAAFTSITLGGLLACA
jgi:hypothetical protein